MLHQRIYPIGSAISRYIKKKTIGKLVEQFSYELMKLRSTNIYYSFQLACSVKVHGVLLICTCEYMKMSSGHIKAWSFSRRTLH